MTDERSSGWRKRAFVPLYTQSHAPGRRSHSRLSPSSSRCPPCLRHAIHHGCHISSQNRRIGTSGKGKKATGEGRWSETTSRTVLPWPAVALAKEAGRFPEPWGMERLRLGGTPAGDDVNRRGLEPSWRTVLRRRISPLSPILISLLPLTDPAERPGGGEAPTPANTNPTPENKHACADLAPLDQG